MGCAFNVVSGAEEERVSDQTSSSASKGVEEAKKESNETIVDTTIPNTHFSIYGYTSKKIISAIELRLSRPNSLNKIWAHIHSENPLTDKIILELDENGLSLKSSRVSDPNDLKLSLVDLFDQTNSIKFDSEPLNGAMYDFGAQNVFATDLFVGISSSNPNSIISQIIAIFNPKMAYKPLNPIQGGEKLCLGSILGKASFQVGEKSKLEFIGFQTVEVVLNVNVLKKLRDEGRL